MEKFDLVVIGGGPGGYVAAIRASQLGKKVALVESQHLGGVCLNWGCIPTKSLLRTAEIYDTMHHLDAYGLSAQKISFDIKKVIDRSRQVAAQLSAGVKGLLKKNKVTVFDGWASFKDPTTIDVAMNDKTTTNLSAPHTIIATGAKARTLPHLQPDGEWIWTAKEAMIPSAIPPSILIIGSGAIGIEFASFYCAFGSDITVVEIQPTILPQEDEEIAQHAQKALEKRGITFLTHSSVESVNRHKKGLDVVIKTPQGVEKRHVSKILIAIGIQGNIENIGLEKTKIKTDRGHIVTDEWGRTDEKNIYAIGDVTAGPWLAHKASHEGIIAVEHLAGMQNIHPLDKSRIPGCTYASPQIASIGLTEKKARAQGIPIKVGKFPFRANGKALAMGEPDGMVKTIFHETTGELLGAHMVGADVTELIQGYSIAKTLETTESELMHTIFPHPTLSEMMHESVLDAYGRVIHF